MTKTTKIRIDDQLDNSSNLAGNRETDHDLALLEAINYHKSGGKFLTAEQSLSNMRAAIERGLEYEL